MEGLTAMKPDSPTTAQDALQAHEGHRGAYSYQQKRNSLERILEGIQAKGTTPRALGTFSPSKKVTTTYGASQKTLVRLDT